MANSIVEERGRTSLAALGCAASGNQVAQRAGARTRSAVLRTWVADVHCVHSATCVKSRLGFNWVY